MLSTDGLILITLVKSMLKLLPITTSRFSIYTMGVVYNECTGGLKHLSMHLLVGLSLITHNGIIYRGI